MLGLTVLAWVGLWFLWKWGRALFTGAWIFSIVLVGVGGPYVLSGVAEVLSDLTIAINGAILGLIYFSDLKRQFGNRIDTGQQVS
jgi:hypothetical protein